MSDSLPLDIDPVMAGRSFTRAEALADGIDAVAIRTLTRRGQIRRIVQGVYVDVAVPDSLELRAEALAKVLPGDSVICRQSAAWLYGIDTAALSDRGQVPLLEFVRPTKSRAVRTAGASGHSQTLLDDDVIEIAGLRVTSPVATAVHLARHLRRPFALSALDAMARAGLVSVYQVRDAVRRYPRHPQIVQARELARVMDARAESPGESWLRLRIIDAGFPAVVPQVQIRTPEQHFRVDLAFVRPMADGRRLALEYDSDLWHGTRRQQVRDARRSRKIEAAGWVVLSVGRGQVWGTEPALENAVGDLLEVRPKLPRRW
jgi:very-short-patch-repair endonuclease